MANDNDNDNDNNNDNDNDNDLDVLDYFHFALITSNRQCSSTPKKKSYLIWRLGASFNIFL